MSLVLVSFLAGVLTIGAPCILPLLPVIVGGSVARTNSDGNKGLKRTLVIIGSLAASIVLFTLLLRFSTALLGVPAEIWQIIAGIIIGLLGASLAFPNFWELLPGINRFNIKSNQLLALSYQKKGYLGDALTGAALGPVFNSCSPTYLFIVAAILPVSFITGFVYLIAYAFGLGIALFVLSIGGTKIVMKIGWLANPNGLFRKSVGLLFIIVALSVVFGLDKRAQTYILDNGWYNPLANIEESLRN